MTDTTLTSKERLRDAEHLLRRARERLASDEPSIQYFLSCIDNWLSSTSGDLMKASLMRFTMHPEYRQMIESPDGEYVRYADIPTGIETFEQHDWLYFDRVPAAECQRCKAVSWANPLPTGPCTTQKASP